MFMDRKNQYSENEYTTQSNLQIQCNPYQATNDIFQRTRTNNYTNCMETHVTRCDLTNLNIRPETIKLLEENIGRTLSDVNCSTIFFDPPPRVTKIKTKINLKDYAQ